MSCIRGWGRGTNNKTLQDALQGSILQVENHSDLEDLDTESSTCPCVA